jgi:NDP-sugar pyrophosphorylase family protein
MSPTLLVLAAGMGSRYGGLKQLDRFGPSGETIMDYSVYDALAAGFAKVVFVIRRDFESPFRAAVGGKYESRVSVEYVFQELGDLPPGLTAPSGRTKPWGTAHAIWCARRAIAEPFVSINADDYYGKTAFKSAAEYLLRPPSSEHAADYCMVGYPVLQTLSEHAPVTRAICRVDESGFLETLAECSKVERTKDGGQYLDSAGKPHLLDGDEVASMNFWGFTPPLFDQLERHLTRFLESQRGAPGASECLIPTVIDELLKEETAKVRVLPTSDAWFGVTHPEDKPTVTKTIGEMVTRGDYPSPIWEQG